MPALRFDQSHRFDTGLEYDSDQPPPVPPSGPIKKGRIVNIIKLDLQNKTVDQKISLGANHITSMDGNLKYPTAKREPTDVAFQAAQTALVTANGAVDAAETVWKAAILDRNNKETAWDLAISARASNCESITPGNRADLQTTGLPLRALPTPVGIPNAPLDLLATAGKITGQINVRWKTVRGASSYIVERMVHTGTGNWAQVKVLSQAKFTDTGLVSGTTYAYRVRALAAAGEGPWSDETVHMAP